MTQGRPKPENSVSVPSYEISDSTAAIKARRLLNRLSEYASIDNWRKVVKEIGLDEGLSSTRNWKRLLFRSRKRHDMICLFFDRKKNFMEWPDTKKTSEVMLIKMSPDDRTSLNDDTIQRGIGLAFLGINRNDILNPHRGTRDSNWGKSGILLSITFHVLQRIIQRGHGLSEDGEIGYDLLLNYLYLIWLTAVQIRAEHQDFPADLTVNYNGTRFIVHAPDSQSTMTLITLLPQKK
jgi:hypothetical protein